MFFNELNPAIHSIFFRRRELRSRRRKKDAVFIRARIRFSRLLSGTFEDYCILKFLFLISFSCILFRANLFVTSVNCSLFPATCGKLPAIAFCFAQTCLYLPSTAVCFPQPVCNFLQLNFVSCNLLETSCNGFIFRYHSFLFKINNFVVVRQLTVRSVIYYCCKKASPNRKCFTSKTNMIYLL